MKKTIMVLTILSLIVVGLVGTTSIALADAPPVVGHDSPGYGFLCPAVGDGVLNAPFDTGTLYSGDQTFLPGHNQSGAYVNPNATNTLGGDASPGPGDGNSDWSPMWPTGN